MALPIITPTPRRICAFGHVYIVEGNPSDLGDTDRSCPDEFWTRTDLGCVGQHQRCRDPNKPYHPSGKDRVPGDRREHVHRGIGVGDETNSLYAQPTT